MNIAIIGSGHVGLVTGACFAELGNQVVCVDNNQEKIRRLKKGQMPIYEPNLEGLVLTNMEEGRLTFTSSIAQGIEEAQIVFITVGTPSTPQGGPDLSAIEKVSREVAKNLKSYKLIVEKSTVPVQTGEWVERTIRIHAPEGAKFDVASNPEFLREGSAVHDFLYPDRVVIGVNSERAASLLVKLYQPLNAPLLITDINSAELIKHASNAFLAMKISFINAVANICERTGADITRVAKGVGLDKRIGEAFLKAGLGYGGSCFPKDVAAFIHIAGKVGYDFRLLKEVERINEEQREQVIRKMEEELGKLSDKVVGVLGLSFKPNTDDVRESPSLKIIPQLMGKGAEVKAYDPQAMDRVKSLLPQVQLCPDPYQVARGSDALLIATQWQEFQYLDLLRLKKLMRNPLILDGRNIFDPVRMKKLGFIYRGVGR